MDDIKDIFLKVRHCRYQQTHPGITWGPRTIPDYELVFIVKEVHHYADSDGLIVAKPGDIILIEPEKEHVFRYAGGPEDGVHACAHFDLVDHDGNTRLLKQFNCVPQRKTRVSDFEYFRMSFKFASREFISYAKYHNDIVNAAIRQIWLKVVQKWERSAQNKVSDIVSQMMDYIRDNLNRHTTRKDIAAKFHYTPEHVNYLFKKELGITPSRFQNRERAIQAFKYICEDGMTVQQAAIKTGYSNQYYFSKVFKDIFGYPPVRVKKYITKEIEGIAEKHISTD